MPSLAVFDFDRTIVQDDSDATIIDKCRERKPPPEWEGGCHDWTPYMSNVFEHAYSSGFHPEDILDSIASMRPTPGLPELLRTLAARGWELLILTDANSVFVRHWLKTHDLQDVVTDVVTNRAFWRQGRLYIEPCMRQASCPRCPPNLCKTQALSGWCGARSYRRLAYVGDGRNDYCPATSLPAYATVFPRLGFPMHDLIQKTLATAEPKVTAKVVPWEDGFRILQELCPDNNISIS